MPDAQYTDLSPKGSIDEGIRELIRDVNALEGLVTTSSCAGRVSVFVEGSKKKEKRKGSRHKSDSRAKKHPAESDDDDDDEAINRVKQMQPQPQQEKEKEKERTFAASGGKGEGHWLYVSHDPVTLDKTGKKSFHELFGLVPGDGKPRIQKADGSRQGIRLVRFHFEPMVGAGPSVGTCVFDFILSWEDPFMSHVSPYPPSPFEKSLLPSPKIMENFHRIV